MSLDGVVQAPGASNEDGEGGFRHGGWHLQYFDDVSRGWVLNNVTSAGAYLLGRRTYENFAAHWPNAPAEDQPLAEPLNTRPKYVASRTLAEPLAWQHSKLLHGDIGRAVNALKGQEGADLLVIGSAALTRSLIERDIVDELRLMIDPLVLGGGKRIFADDGAYRPLRLIESKMTTTGAILANFAPVEQKT
jgi:dihydrofolate reductase